MQTSKINKVWLFSALCMAFIPECAQCFSLNAGWKWYTDLLIQKPLLTKAVTSCGTNAFSDVMCQKLLLSNVDENDEDKKKLDKERLAHAAVTGLIWSGPVTHYWYKILFGKLTVGIKDPILGLIAQIVLDAIIFSPVTVSGYFAVRSLLEGSGLKGIQEKLTTRLFSTVIGAWKFWPAANVVNFSIVPLSFRVLYMNVLSVFWSGYLTFVNSKKMSTTAKE